jgi:hypothetical protein
VPAISPYFSNRVAKNLSQLPARPGVKNSSPFAGRRTQGTRDDPRHANQDAASCIPATWPVAMTQPELERISTDELDVLLKTITKQTGLTFTVEL